jgi:UDP-2-acetamido-2-deoxy-ribo-hexuluronate aminotransferase
MHVQFIDLTIQQKAIREELDRRIAAVLNHGQYIMGPEVKELEEVLSDYVGVRHCITVSSGTDALLISLMALGIGPGDEVITTPFTFISTAEVIALLGATPVFVDVERDTGLINARLIEREITPRTKAILPVSLYGQVPDIDSINRIAKQFGDIPVIEDAAQSFGATVNGRRSCSLSTIGCTSFFPSKPLGCYGDGGAVFTNSDIIAEKIRAIRIHGQEERYRHSMIGVCGRLDTLQAAVLLAKWPRFSWELGQRQLIAERYKREIECEELDFIRPLEVRDNSSSVYAQYTVTVEDRELQQARLRKLGIPTAVHYPTIITKQSGYHDYAKGSSTPVAAWLSKHVLSLPMGPDLSAADQLAVVEALREIGRSSHCRIHDQSKAA